VGASPEVGPAPGSPATRAASESDEGEDFGEEAPTEIFGEIDHGANPALAAAAAMAATRPAGALPLSGASPPPTTRPPRPPPVGRAPTSRGDVPSHSPGIAGNGAGSPGRTPAPEMGFAPSGGAPLGPPVGAPPLAAGSPGMMPVAPLNGAPVNP